MEPVSPAEFSLGLSVVPAKGQFTFPKAVRDLLGIECVDLVGLSLRLIQCYPGLLLRAIRTLRVPPVKIFGVRE